MRSQPVLAGQERRAFVAVTLAPCSSLGTRSFDSLDGLAHSRALSALRCATCAARSDRAWDVRGGSGQRGVANVGSCYLRLLSRGPVYVACFASPQPPDSSGGGCSRSALLRRW